MEREIGNFYIEGYNFDTKTYDNKENTLLLVIDLQEKLMPAIYESEKIIKNSKTLLKVFDMYGIKKIATEQYPKGLGQSVDEIKAWWWEYFFKNKLRCNNRWSFFLFKRK